MKVRIKKRFYKRSQVGRNPMVFEAKQPKGIHTDIYAVINIDPILRKKKHKDLRDGMLKHEKDEIYDWGKGCDKAHHHAKRKEKKLTRSLKSVDGFWREIKRREKK